MRAKKKKFPAWNIPTEYVQSVLCTYRRTTSVGKSVGDISYRPNISVCKCVGILYRRLISLGEYVGDGMNAADIVQCRRRYSVGEYVGDGMEYHRHCPMPTDLFRR